MTRRSRCSLPPCPSCCRTARVHRLSGTDTSLVGWKENFNMSYLETVPAQARAQYAQEVIRACKHRPYRIGGHSKGGNLAAWAAVHLPEKLQGKRLLAAYNNDGPGFHADLLDTPAYRRVEDRLHTYIPESSIVGVLLVHAEDYDVIDSTSHAAMQHEALSWQVMGNRFVHLGQRSSQADVRRRREWLTPCLRRISASATPLYSISPWWPPRPSGPAGAGSPAGRPQEGVCRSHERKEADPDRGIRAAGHRRKDEPISGGRACGPPDTASGRWDRTSWAAVNRIKHRQNRAR
ncbi:MAG: Mbeg1-like protein [Oscillospiraceae bacterium]